MSNLNIGIPLMILACLIAGCGSGSGSKLKKGDIVVAEEKIRASAETQWEDNYTDGFTTEIPKGTRLEVLYTPAATANVVECRPVEVNGVKDPEEVEAFFVPEAIRIKEGYVSYAFSLKDEYLGKELKKEN